MRYSVGVSHQTMRARHARLHRGPYVAVQLALLVLVLSSVVAVAVASAAAAPQQTDADASVAGVASSTGEEGMGAEDGASPLPDFAAMRVKQLRAVLAERGVRCVGCVEKAHFVERARWVHGHARKITLPCVWVCSACRHACVCESVTVLQSVPTCSPCPPLIPTLG